MDFENFKEKLVEWMEERFHSHFECHEVIKNNGVRLTGIVERVPGKNISPNIYINDLYDSVQNGMTFGAAATIVEKQYEEARKANIENVADIRKFDEVKEKIVACLVNRRMNEELLKNVPHKFIADDLAIIYRYMHSKDDMGIASALIHNSEFEEWNASLDELHGLAMKNTQNIFPAHIDSLQNIIRKAMIQQMGHDMPEYFREQFIEKLEEDLAAMTPVKMYVVTNDIGINGATSILYPSVQEWIKEKLGEDVYILPSSTHEVIVVQDKEMDYEFLKQMVTEINQTEVGVTDLLSDNVYQVKNNELINVNQFGLEIDQVIEEAFQEPPENDIGFEL